MSNIFASRNQHALFPMAISFPTISKEDYLLFYKKDRTLFTILLVILHREAVQSILVMGFLLWLEREGYTSKNLVKTILVSLNPDGIDRIANDVVTCLKFLDKKAAKNFIHSEGTSRTYDISVLQFFLDRKCLQLEELYQNRDSIFNEVSFMASELSNKAFDDILERFIRCGEPLVVHRPNEVTVGGCVGGFRYTGPAVPFPSYDITEYVGCHPQTITDVDDAHHQAIVTHEVYMQQQRDLALNSLYNRSHSLSVVRDTEEEIPRENRTIFLTFSKGYPISEHELRDYFTRMFGDFIETIFMQRPVEPENQPLFARIVARSPSMVSAVVDRDGANGRSKYYINGKHVWARKYVKRTPSFRDSNGGGTPPGP